MAKPTPGRASTSTSANGRAAAAKATRQAARHDTTAYRLGFGSQAAFARAFKRIVALLK
jgi:AraC-like DNA-binding protein